MTVIDDVHGTTGNLFLDALDAKTAAALFAYAEPIEAAAGTIVSAARSATTFVTFPIDCAVSVMTRMSDGTDVEATLIGREGFYGVHVALGNDVSSNEAVIQLPGSFLRVPSADFLYCLRTNPPFERHVLSYANATIEMLSRFTACNRLHSINERGARWLLMAHDRVRGDTVYITHEYLAAMLGVRRPGVSLATAAFDQLGYIDSQRGRIVIKDRIGLEKTACRCYNAVNATLERIVGYKVRKP